MLVQRYRTKILDEPEKCRPGCPIFEADDTDVIGFVCAYDLLAEVADILLFEQQELNLLPHQTFVAATVDADAVLAECANVLKHADFEVQQWWREACVDTP